MPSQDKLIKQGILLTDNLFDEIAKRLSRGVKASDTLEAFLNQTKEYTTNNPLVLNGYKDKMLELILQETNNHKFSRPAQRELTRATIEKRVGDRIVDVGEDIVQSVRDIVKWGYNNNKSQDEIADEITHRVEVIKNTRARTIARTEIARTATASDYVINRERGATHYTVGCRNTCCDKCAMEYHGVTNETPDTGSREFLKGNPVEFDIKDVEHLPPLHPNCYDRETKVYTINGWKYFKDLSDDDLLLSMNPKGNELEFIKPIRLIKYKNTDKKLYHIHNRWFDVCVTEDHDCFIHQRRDGGSKGRYLEPQFRKPSELTSESKFIRCIDVDRENPKVVNINGLEFEPKDFAFFMAWFISEGSVLHNPETAKQHGYPVKITQEIGENREVLERELQRIFGYLGFRVAIGKSYFEVYSKQLYDYLLPLGYSNEKYIPSEVFTLNKECLNIFLDNYVLGDGHERVSDNEMVQNSSERALFTSSPRLRDDLSYLVLLCGYYPSISLHTPKGKVSAHKNGTYVQNNTVFRIAVNKSKHTNYSGCTVDLIEYNDYVYCAELPKWHTLWVMRDGKTSWNGNCRCYARYSIKGGSSVKARKTPYSVQTSTAGNTSAQTIDPNDKRALALALTPEELNAMSFQELSDYFGLKYKGAERDLVRKEVEHMFIEEFEDGRRMAIYFDDKAIESYTKKGIATPNEIIAEIMKVPLSLRNETNNIHFRDNDEGIYVVNESGNIVRRDLDSNTLGYNATRVMGTDYTHQIIINPRLFKGSRGPGAKLWIPNDEDILRWKKNIHHEFEHSGDQDLELFNSDDYMPHCWSDEYDEVHQKERYFTEYANSDRSESWAEHGGYISYMEANPSEQHRLITIMVYDEQKGFVEKKINYSQYKKEYPLHYKYFMKRHKG